MKDITKEWGAIEATLSRLREHLNQALEMLPQYGSARKLRGQIEKSWQEVVDTSDVLDELVNSRIEPLPVDFPWTDKDFVGVWQLYKDYLLEQHGIEMQSRMEGARLRYIIKFSGSDRNKAIELIEYYMSYGGSNIFPVNFTQIPDKDGKTAISPIQIKLLA